MHISSKYQSWALVSIDGFVKKGFLLPWWEGIKGRGIKLFEFYSFFTLTPTLSPQGRGSFIDFLRVHQYYFPVKPSVKV